MFHKKRVLAVVPARGGSKRVERKNLRRCAGLTLIEHVARITASLLWLDATFLSTDDAEIAELGESLGLAVPELRPRELATDEADSLSVWRHALLRSEALHENHFDMSILLEPSSPFRTIEDIETTLSILVKGQAEVALTLSPTPPRFAPNKAIHILASDHLSAISMPNSPSTYHRNGLCYAATREAILNRQDLLGKGVIGVPVERTVVNIDTEEDLALANLLLQH